MVPILARGAVIIKCCADTDTGIMLGNYECSYALGLLAQLAGGTLPEPITSIAELHAAVLEQAKNYQPADNREKLLLQMLKGYKPEDTFDEQMPELVWMGYRETRIWKR